MDLPQQQATPSDIPSLDRLLRHSHFEKLIASFGHEEVARVTRNFLSSLRDRAIAGNLLASELDVETLARDVDAQLNARRQSPLRPVFNLTGTVLHTNLGRSALPQSAIDAVSRAMRDPVSLEWNADSGERGDRDNIVSDLLRELTGAEDATIVNNNAAAVLLLLNTFAHRRECIVSRGELVEIGGSFRIPDVMRTAGARLIEVGTTNRTHLSDYADAIGERTSLLMKVHTSNYAIRGFTHSVDIDELARLGRERGIPLAVDLGSGSLIDLTRFKLPHEPTMRDTLAAGADLVTFSGDKLLGGPQCGIVAGRKDLIARLKRNPFKRALRVDKMTLAALHAVLDLYRMPEFLAERLTSLRLLTRDDASIQTQAERLLPAMRNALDERFIVEIASTSSQIGSGALPVDNLASYAFAIRVAPGKRASLDKLEEKFRAVPRPVIGRIADKTYWLDLRCLAEGDEAEFVARLPHLRE